MADGDAEEAVKKPPKQGRLKRGSRPGAPAAQDVVDMLTRRVLLRHSRYAHRTCLVHESSATIRLATSLESSLESFCQMPGGTMKDPCLKREYTLRSACCRVQFVAVHDGR